MTKQMGAKAAALVFVLRHPPKPWAVKRLKLKDIPDEIQKAGCPRPTFWQVKWQAQHFGARATQRGRKHGWRKTTPAEDKQVLGAEERA